MSRQQGISLIEVVIFIMIIGILGASILATFNVAGNKTLNVDNQIQALEYAQQRMDLILGQKAIQGFSTFTDPCPGPTLCSTPGYVVSSTIANNWNGDTNYKVIAITVTGNGTASLQSLVANF